MSKICVLGLGYIGLPTSVMFAQSGVKVIGVDISKDVVDTLNRGEMHIEEPGLGELVRDVVKSGMFKASLEPEEADAFIVAVPTPNNNDRYKSCNLDYVVSATRALLPYVKKGNSIIIESTIGPRTIDDVIRPMIEEYGFIIGEEIFLAHCPERVLPGQIIKEMVENNRIVGGYTARCADEVSNLYKAFVKGEIIKTDAKTAEMSKLMENTFRDVNIALANELAKVCNSLDINVLDVIQMANKHPRVNIHQPGPGVGGHCLAVDPYFIVEKAPDLAKIISLSRETNCSMPQYVVDCVDKILKDVDNPIVSVCGITYKGNIDDVRESPALEIIEMLQEKGYEVRIHDPHVKDPNILNISYEEAINAADLLLVLADHSEFEYLDPELISSIMRSPIVFDTKNKVKNLRVTNTISEAAITIEDSLNKIQYINFGNLYQYI